MVKVILTCVFFVLTQVHMCLGVSHQSDQNWMTTEVEEVYSKHYVAADQIAVTENGIWVLSDEKCWQVSAIFCDAEGYYFVEEEEGVYWICSQCGTLNSLSRSSCSRCGQT